MKLTRTLWLLLGMGFSFVACNDSSDDEVDNEIIQQYLQDNNLTANLHGSGVFYIPLQTVSNGKAVTENSIVSMYFTLSLLDGTVLDDHQEQDGQPKRLLQSIDTTIPAGIFFGLSVMSVGETYQHIIPSRLAFGNQQGANIPPNAILICTIEVVDVFTPEELTEKEKEEIDAAIVSENLGTFEAQESGLYYQKVQSGNGTKPTDGSDVTVAYTGTFLDGAEFDSGDSFPFTLGEGAVIEGFDEGVRLMEYGETAKIILPSSLAYGASFFVIPESVSAVAIPPFSIIMFEITLREP